MIDWIVISQALIREVINGMSMVLFFTLTFLTWIFMWDTFIDKAKPDWRHERGIPTACALWWVFAAETYRTGAVWWLYQLGKEQGSAGVFFTPDGYATSYGYLIAGAMLIGGLLRSIYIFTPPKWERRVWLYALTGSLVFCSIPILSRSLGKVLLNGF